MVSIHGCHSSKNAKELNILWKFLLKGFLFCFCGLCATVLELEKLLCQTGALLL